MGRSGDRKRNILWGWPYSLTQQGDIQQIQKQQAIIAKSNIIKSFKFC